ncbi:F-box protein [Melia azedarach]|uniref:F-box protein n=1 Tax=Melia azedarach TaxID=155640 RepID=A0ACC1Y119_MELAZ|nr:F-box protein [Melia azedarach]
MQQHREIYKAIDAAAAKNKKTKKSTLASVTETPLNHSIPTDVVTDILSFLPVKSLLRFRCLSKEWRDLIEDRRFIQMHMYRGGNRIIKSKVGEPCDFDIDETFKVLFEDNRGLLVLRNKVNQSYHIRNPATRQMFDLPTPSFNSFLMFMFQDQYTGLYKVFSVYTYRKNICSGGCEILTVGIDDHWRPLEASEHLHDFGETTEMFYVSTPSNGAIHIVRIREQKLIKAVWINLKNECATVISTLPQGFFSDSDKLSPFCWEGKLSFYTVVNMELHVLVLEDYMKQRFSESKIVIPALTFMDEDEKIINVNIKPQFARDGMVIFVLNDEEIIAYDYIERRIIKNLDMKEYEEMYVGECLTSFNGMRAENQQEKQLENPKNRQRRRKRTQKGQKSKFETSSPLFQYAFLFLVGEATPIARIHRMVEVGGATSMGQIPRTVAVGEATSMGQIPRRVEVGEAVAIVAIAAMAMDGGGTMTIHALLMLQQPLHQYYRPALG